MLRRPATPLITRINVGPMAGLIFGLIILLATEHPMITCGPRVSLPSVSAAWPSIDPASTAPTIGMLTDGRIFFRGVSLEGLAELGPRVAEHMAERASEDRTIILKADAETSYGDVVNILKECLKAGVTDVRLVANQSPRG